MEYKHLMHEKVKLHSAMMVKIIKESKPLPLINASKAIKNEKQKMKMKTLHAHAKRRLVHLCNHQQLEMMMTIKEYLIH